MSLVWIATLSLGGIGAISAIILYLVAQKFKVYEDPRNGQVEAVLPGANCGGCGYPGCGGFAAACVKADSLDGMLCPVGGAPVMAKIAAILGMEAGEVTPKVAVVRCNGNCANRKRPITTTVHRAARSKRPCTAAKQVAHTVAWEMEIVRTHVRSELFASIPKPVCPKSMRNCARHVVLV